MDKLGKAPRPTKPQRGLKKGMPQSASNSWGAYLWNIITKPARPVKGISIIHNETKDRRYLQIDRSEVDRSHERIEDRLDLIITDSEEDGESIPLEEMKRLLKEDGKL